RSPGSGSPWTAPARRRPACSPRRPRPLRPGGRRGSGTASPGTGTGCSRRGELFPHLTLEPEEDRRHAPQPEAGDHVGQPEVIVEVVRRTEHLVGAGSFQTLAQDPGEAPGGGRF